MSKVVVSLLDPQSFRESKEAKPIRYPAGLVTMPLEHAQAMGLLHRIRGVTDEGDAVPVGTPWAFNGLFDEDLTRILQSAGYQTVDDLRQASQDALRATPGIGPANYERIQNALKGA